MLLIIDRQQRGLAIDIFKDVPGALEEAGRAFGDMNFDHFRGSITTDSETHEACLVVDGKKMSLADLERVLSTYEGRHIEVRITEEG